MITKVISTIFTLLAIPSIGFATPSLNEAKIAYDTGNYDVAEGKLTEIVEKFPDDPVALLMLGLTYDRLNNSLMAEKTFKNYLALSEDDFKPAPVGHLYLSRALRAEKKYLEAIEQFRIFNKNTASSDHQQHEYAQTLLEFSVYSMKAKLKEGESQKCLSEANSLLINLEKNGYKNPWLENDIGRVEFAIGKGPGTLQMRLDHFQVALKYFELALKKHPDNSVSKMNLISTYLGIEEVNSLIGWNAVDLKPRNFELERKAFQGALEAGEKALHYLDELTVSVVNTVNVAKVKTKLNERLLIYKKQVAFADKKIVLIQKK
jgi:tetratricopeptide (TPR) repeat protein